MPLIQCIDADQCRKANCRFIHPDQPQWTSAIESSLTKRKRAAAAAAAGHGYQDSGYGSRSKGRDSGRGSIASSIAVWGDTSSGKATPQRRDPSPGWGTSNTGGGRGNSGSGGWGAASPANDGWGNSSSNDGWGNKSGDGGFGNTSSTGWGNPEPSSRRTSTFSAPKSPEKAPASPRRERESDKSPSRHGHSSSSSSKEGDRDRGRGREKDRDRDRDSRREEDNLSPSRSHHSHRRSPSLSKSSSRRESNRSPERPKPKSSHAASDAMDIDTPNPSSIEATSSLSVSALKDVSAAPVSTTSTTNQPSVTIFANRMPISIAFPRVRQHDGPPPLGFTSASRTHLPSAQLSMPPPPPPSNAPPVVPSPPATVSTTKSPPQSSGATKPHSLPTRPRRATGSRSPPQTRTLATPMVPLGSPKHAATPATPVTPVTPAALVIPTVTPVPPAPATLATSVVSVPSVPVPSATPSAARPYEWIESLDTLIKQNQVLRNCKKQYERAEAQEKILLSKGANMPKRGMGDIAPSMAEMRRRIESTESDMQALMAKFATRMDMFYRPTEVVKQVDVGKSDEETLNLARKLSDQVSLLEAEMQQLQITAIKPEQLKKLEESIKSGSQALLKERGERTKVVEDVKKDVKVLGDDLNRTKIEYERLREELITNGSNLEQVRCDAQSVREQQVIVKEEVKAVKIEADATKADVQTVKTKMGEVGKEVAEIKVEVERLKTRLKTPPPSPAPAPALAPATGAAPGKRARNGVLPHGSNAMEVDDVLPPAKRVRTVDPLRPSPFIDSTTPFGSPRSVQHDGPSQKELLERIDALEDLVETLQGDVLQVETDVQDRLEEINERLGSSEARIASTASTTESKSESAPPSSVAKADFVRAAGRSSAPPTQTTFPASWGPAKLPTVEELPSDDAIGTLRVDLDAMMGQVAGLWKAEGEWPAQVNKNLCKALGVGSLDEVFKPVPPPAPEPVVNGKKPKPEEDWVEMFKSMKEEQVKIREEMKKERAEQDARVKGMMERLERTEEALDKSVKRRDEVERECEVLKAQQAEQRQLLVHLQSVVDILPKPGNGMLSPEGLLQDAVRNGASPVRQELAALRKLATTVPYLLALAGISAEKDH